MDYFPTAEAMAEGLGLELLLRGDLDPRLLTRKARLSEYAADPLVSGNLYHRIREILVREQGRPNLGRVVLWITAPAGTLEQVPWAVGLAEQLTRQDLRVFLLGRELPRMLPGSVGMRGEALPSPLRGRVALLHREPAVAVRADLEGVRLVLPSELGFVPQPPGSGDAWAALLLDGLPEDPSGPYPSRDLVDGVVLVSSFRDHSARELTDSVSALDRAGFSLIGVVGLGPAPRTAAHPGDTAPPPPSVWRTDPSRPVSETQTRGLRVLSRTTHEPDLRTGRALYGAPTQPRTEPPGARTSPRGESAPDDRWRDARRGEGSTGATAETSSGTPSPKGESSPSSGSGFAAGGGGSILENLRQDGLDRRPSFRSSPPEPASTFPDVGVPSESTREAPALARGETTPPRAARPPAERTSATSAPAAARTPVPADGRATTPSDGGAEPPAGRAPMPNASAGAPPAGPAPPIPAAAGSAPFATVPRSPAAGAGSGAPRNVRPNPAGAIPSTAETDAARERSVALFAHWEKESLRRSRRRRAAAWLVSAGALVAAGFLVARSWPSLVERYSVLEAIAPASKETPKDAAGRELSAATEASSPDRAATAETSGDGAVTDDLSSKGAATDDLSRDGASVPDPSLLGVSSTRDTAHEGVAATGTPPSDAADAAEIAGGAPRSEQGLPEMYRAPDIAPTLTFPDRLRIPQLDPLVPRIELPAPPAGGTSASDAVSAEPSTSTRESSREVALLEQPPAAGEAMAREATAGEPPASEDFAVQLASYKLREEAETDIRGWAELEVDARIVVADVPGKGRWYRVVTGRFATFSQAREEAQRLAARIGLETTHVVSKDGRGQPVPVTDAESESTDPSTRDQEGSAEP